MLFGEACKPKLAVKNIKRPDLPVQLTANQRRLAVGVGAFFSIHKGGNI